MPKVINLKEKVLNKIQDKVIKATLLKFSTIVINNKQHYLYIVKTAENKPMLFTMTSSGSYPCLRLWSGQFANYKGIYNPSCPSLVNSNLKLSNTKSELFSKSLCEKVLENIIIQPNSITFFHEKILLSKEDKALLMIFQALLKKEYINSEILTIIKLNPSLNLLLKDIQLEIGTSLIDK